jgi:hypothetical protein
MADKETGRNPEKMTIFEEEILQAYRDEASKASWIEKIGLMIVVLVRSIIRGWTEIILPSIYNFLKPIFARIAPLVDEKEDEAWEAVLDFLESSSVMSRKLAESLLRFKGLPFPFNSLFNLLVISGWIKDYVGTVSSATLSQLQRALNAQYSPNLPPAETMIQSAFIAPEKTEEIRKILREQGLSDNHIDLMFIAAYRLYDVDTIRNLYLRGAIDEAKMKERMAELGFTEERIEEIRKTWEIIPGPQDLLTMVAHEAFEEDMQERYGLKEEFPDEQTPYLAAHGLNRYWQERYWISHWQHPSPGQILQMLHRRVKKPDGKTFSMEDVYEYFRLVEIPPYWRNMLAEISYLPYTRVDTRRMHEMGVLKDEELVKAYMDQGYDEEHAKKMAEYTIRYNSDERSKLTKDQIIKAYRNSMLSRNEAKELLKSIKLSDDIAEWNLLYADFEEQLEIQELYIDAAKERYIDNLWDEQTTRAALMKLNLPGARIDALIEKWSTKRIADRKLPSKTDLDKFLRNGIINKDTYRLEMYKLGYSFEYTDWYIRLVDMKKAG